MEFVQHDSEGSREAFHSMVNFFPVFPETISIGFLRHSFIGKFQKQKKEIRKKGRKLLAEYAGLLFGEEEL